MQEVPIPPDGGDRVEGERKKPKGLVSFYY